LPGLVDLSLKLQGRRSELHALGCGKYLLDIGQELSGVNFPAKTWYAVRFRHDLPRKRCKHLGFRSGTRLDPAYSHDRWRDFLLNCFSRLNVVRPDLPRREMDSSFRGSFSLGPLLLPLFPFALRFGCARSKRNTQ
jgi:hypothetical protein